MTSFVRQLLLWSCLAGVAGLAQTTQGLITGRVVDAEDGTPLDGVQVSFRSEVLNVSGASRTGHLGYYVLPLLPPGRYRIRVEADRYQAQELQELDLPVAAFLEVNFRLRLLGDVWQQGQYRGVFLPGTQAVLTFYGPDVDTSRWNSFERSRGTRGGLESTVSQVINPLQLSELPLAGRDVYTMLVTLPGVTADTTTARGLGLAINGQRPSASNFLLDGLENNNNLVTGPLTTVAPEAVQEYRISTNNFSAEYGRTSGFLANAITRSGGSAWHGLGYYYLKNEALHANDFQRNFAGLPRTPVHETQPGFWIGGPVRRQTLFVSGSFEYLRSRSQGEPQDFSLPTTDYVAFTRPDSIAGRLLRQYPGPALSGPGFTADTKITPPVSVDRYLALPRADYVSPGGAHRLLARVALAALRRPDFIWTPYPDFVSPLRQESISAALSLTSTLSPRLTNEARLGWSLDDLRWDRAHPEVPVLASNDATLPGSPIFYGYRNRSRGWEFADNMIWGAGRHVAKAGGGVLLRSLTGHLTAGRDPQYIFRDVLDFAFDRPRAVDVSVERLALPDLRLPQFERAYRHNQFYFYFQDSVRLTSRLTVNFGARYERFSAPSNVGAVKDAAVELGPGTTLAQKLSGARLTSPVAGDAQLYDADHNDWAARVGVSYSLRSDGRTLLRAAYGNFYDRPFDNLWQNLRANNIVLALFPIAKPQTDYLAPIGNSLSQFRNIRFAQDFPDLTLYQPGIRSSYTHSYFAGVEHQLTSALTVQVNGLGSLGRKLLTTDLINRAFSVSVAPDQFLANPFGRYSAALPNVLYRGNQGLSQYHGLAVSLQARTRRMQTHVSYTWSHTIDNQSDPLLCDFFDLSFTRITAGGGCESKSAFARQFDSRGDRGNSDFDQRHNLVMFSIWELPPAFSASRAAPVFRGWRASSLLALRSGFPYTVRVPPQSSFDGEPIENNRANLLNPAGVSANQSTAPGGRLLLNAAAFAEPTPGTLGNMGRNSLIGPGLFNVDLSLSRSFGLPQLREGVRLTVRADAFNLLNHANLNNPDAFLGSSTFGVALYGRRGRTTGFPAVSPLNETARQVQLLVRLLF